jgi:hypothetical protein
MVLHGLLNVYIDGDFQFQETASSLIHYFDKQ